MIVLPIESQVQLLHLLRMIERVVVKKRLVERVVIMDLIERFVVGKYFVERVVVWMRFVEMVFVEMVFVRCLGVNSWSYRLENSSNVTLIVWNKRGFVFKQNGFSHVWVLGLSWAMTCLDFAPLFKKHVKLERKTMYIVWPSSGSFSPHHHNAQGAVFVWSRQPRQHYNWK